MWNIQKVTNDVTKQTKPHRCTDANKGVVVTRGGGSGGRANWAKEVNIYIKCKWNTNTPMKRQRLLNGLKARHNYMLFTRDALQM